jgi:hypothetical protein
MRVYSVSQDTDADIHISADLWPKEQNILCCACTNFVMD